MDRLPGELIVHLCSVLPKSEIKAFRLSCRQFAVLGEASLFRSFEFRLWPATDRLAAFEQLVQNPSIASKLRKLSLTTGVPLEYADYRYWQAQVYKELSSDWSQSYSGTTPMKDEYNNFHRDLQARFTERSRTDYELYRQYLDVEAEFFADQLPLRLRRALDHLSQHIPELKYQLTMSEPQISLEAVEGFRAPTDLLTQGRGRLDPRSIVLKRRQAVLDHFSGFLLAIAESRLQFNDLVLHRLPVQLLELPRDSSGLALDRAFRRPSNVDLSISSLPHSDWLSRTGMAPARMGRNRRLRHLLDRPSRLESLCLELAPGREAELSFTLFDQGHLHSSPRRFLKSLTTLSLSRFTCRWSDLRGLLQDASELQHLTLAHARLGTGSMVDIVTFIPSLRLQTIQLLGTWNVNQDRGEWHAHTPDDFSNCVNATDFEGPYVSNGLRSVVETFMVTGIGKCPFGEQASWDLLGDTSWHYIPG